jgi:hypothetical protein
MARTQRPVAEPLPIGGTAAYETFNASGAVLADADPIALARHTLSQLMKSAT